MFVSTASVLYGQDFMSYNIHNLTHIADDISNHSSSLQEISGFTFEITLELLKSIFVNVKIHCHRLLKESLKLKILVLIKMRTL